MVVPLRCCVVLATTSGKAQRMGPLIADYLTTNLEDGDFCCRKKRSNLMIKFDASFVYTFCWFQKPLDSMVLTDLKFSTSFSLQKKSLSCFRRRNWWRFPRNSPVSPWGPWLWSASYRSLVGRARSSGGGRNGRSPTRVRWLVCWEKTIDNIEKYRYTSSSRASRWRKFQKKKELYSQERICL